MNNSPTMRGISQLPVLSAGFGMLATLFVGLMFAQSWPAFAPLAIGAGIAALLCWPWDAAAQGYDLSDEGLIHNATGELLAWNSLDSVFCSGRCPDPALVSKGRIVAWFGNQKVALKTPDGMTASKLYEQLWAIALNNYEVELQVDSMRVHFQNEVDTHGSDNVIGSCSKTATRVTPRVPGRIVLAFLVVLIAGIVSTVLDHDNVAGVITTPLAGMIFGILALLWLVSKLSSKSKNTGELVLSPAGLALHTDALKGKMSWTELVSIDLAPSATKPTQIKVKVAGAEFILPDGYQHPAWHLYREMVRLQALEFESIKTSSHEPVVIQPPVDTGNPYQPPQTL